MKFTDEILAGFNAELKSKDPIDIVKWAIEFAEKPVVTTNFRPYESAILYATTQANPAIPVLWCDTGYNTPETYRFAQKLIDDLNLNVDIFVPKQTAAYRDVLLGIPEVDDPHHAEFSEQVKLEPFRRALATHQPDVWFTNLRKGQTSLRDNLDILSLSKDGVLKVSPFYYFSDEALDVYLEANQLPNEHRYFDPTKALANRECGIHQ